MRGKTSLYPANAHSLRIESESLFRGNGAAMVLVEGIVLGILLNPKAMATSSIISHAWRISERVGGTKTSSSPEGNKEPFSDIFSSMVTIWAGERSTFPMLEIMYLTVVVNLRMLKSGVICFSAS